MESPDTHIPGFGFDPTKEQLLAHFLKQRILDYFRGASNGTHSHLIPDIELYECDPKDLPRFFRANSQAVPNRKQWFFFCRPNKKYRNSKCSERTVPNIGYWKVTCKERPVIDEDSEEHLGSKRTLAFHRGRAPKGVRTGWLMHEYHLNPTILGYQANAEMPYVLCCIKKDDDNDNDDDGDESIDQGTLGNLGGYGTQAPPTHQEVSGDKDSQFWGSLSSIQNLGSDFQGYNNSYKTYAETDEGCYNNNKFYYGNGFDSSSNNWMSSPNYDNYQQHPNSWNPYNY